MQRLIGKADTVLTVDLADRLGRSSRPGRLADCLEQ